MSRIVATTDKRKNYSVYIRFIPDSRRWRSSLLKKKNYSAVAQARVSHNRKQTLAASNYRSTH